MDHSEKNLKGWEKFLDRKQVKGTLLRSSMYLFAYELLIGAVVGRVKDVYHRGYDDQGDIYSPEYDEKVAKRKFNGRPFIFLSSLHWLMENGAISNEDIERINAIREFRNIVAHRIDTILTDIELEITEEKEKELFNYLQKIERWWVREFEIPANPAFDGMEVPDEEIIPGRVNFYNYVMDIQREILAEIK